MVFDAVFVATEIKRKYKIKERSTAIWFMTSGRANRAGCSRSNAQAVPCHPCSPASMRSSRRSSRYAPALFIAPENSRISWMSCGA